MIQTDSFFTWGALDAVLAVAGIILARQLVKRRAASTPLPPGPRRLPLIGNVLDMPASHEWLTFARWGEKYGDMVYVDLLGQSMLILNSAQVAVELLEKKSTIYSDRPTLLFGGELLGWKNTFGLLPYGDRFREYRRFFARFMGSRSQVERFAPLQEQQARVFLRHVLQDPEQMATHLRKVIATTIMKLSHGIDVQEGKDPFVDLAERAMAQFSHIATPGAFLVDMFPSLQYIPKWLPGGGYKKLIKPWRQLCSDGTELPFEFVKSRMEDRTNVPNFTSELLENENLDEQKILNIKWAASAFYAAGADTTVSFIYSFFLAMTLYPEVQRRAQEEIDAVIGSDVLPTFADRENLPYLEALISEVHRWNPVTPLGVPHHILQGDIHNGYLIPPGTTVVANTWQMMHDPAVYPDPFAFDPSRFLDSPSKPAAPNPRNIAFGFGRRICPGLHLADGSIFITCALSLAAFDISKVVENGQVVEPHIQYTTGTVSHPEPFKCSIKPRSAKAEALIRSFEH